MAIGRTIAMPAINHRHGRQRRVVGLGSRASAISVVSVTRDDFGYGRCVSNKSLARNSSERICINAAGSMYEAGGLAG
jgi:hypothetical protein